MKKTQISLFTLLLIFAIVISTTSCKKEENTTPKYQSAIDNSRAENLYNGAFKQISQYSVVVDTGTKFNNKTYPILTISGVSYPKTFTLDFGTRTLCEDGRTRSGKIITLLSAPYLDSLTTIHSTFDNYYETVNSVDYHLTGVHNVLNMGRNSLHHPVYRVQVDSASVISPEGTIKWTSTRYREFTAGYDSWLNPFDDAYLITGSANGTDINGDAFTVTITQGLQVQFGCPFIKAGKIEVINAGRPTIYIDYGSGECDASAVVTVNGYTVYIIMG
ncbi:MAG: hypothetical protein WCP69_13175 [Bacteroidota bacterium]